MKRSVIILSIVFVILLVMNLKVFFFQRTLRKVHLKTGIPMSALSAAYPTSYMLMVYLSFLRWGIIIVLFFLNWIVAIGCLILNFLLPIILPEQDDYKNILTAREILRHKKYNSTLEDELMSIDFELEEIQRQIEQQ